MRGVKFAIFIAVAGFVTVSCSGVKHLDVSVVQSMSQDTEAVNVGQECEYIYETKKWDVAVVEFANNTGYGKMDVRNKDTQGVGVSRTNSAGIGAGSVNRYGDYVGVGVGTSKTVSAYSSNSTEFMGEFAPSLGSFAQSITEETLSNLGGVGLVNRSYLNKILSEQKFQMTLANPDTIMEFGKISGVKYIFTGSVDNIQASYTEPTNVQSDGSGVGMILSAISAGYNVALSGWVVSATVTLTLLDGETGSVIYSKAFKGEERATQSRNFQPDLIINTAKKIMENSVKSAASDLANLFEMKGYINEIRGGKKVARVSLGASNGLKPGDVLEIYDVDMATDFRTKESSCNLMKLNAKITISNQISEDGAWGFISGSKSALERIKRGSLVKRVGLGVK